MIQVNGQWICESLAEVVDPRRSALLVVDVQNDYCAPEGRSPAKAAISP